MSSSTLIYPTYEGDEVVGKTTCPHCKEWVVYIRGNVFVPCSECGKMPTGSENEDEE